MKFLHKVFKESLLTKGGVEAIARCPECGTPGKKKLCIRLDNYFYHCWVCGIKGRSIGWLLKKYSPQLKDFQHLKDLKPWSLSKQNNKLFFESPPNKITSSLMLKKR